MKYRSGFIDVQDAGGFHLWAGVDVWDDANGHSRRLFYGRLSTWDQAREMQLDYGVRDENMGVDTGHRFREVLTQCQKYRWYGYKGDDAQNFPHYIDSPLGKNLPRVCIYRPWSTTQINDPLSGKVVETALKMHRFALTRMWSNPSIYPILYNLKNGDGRYYGIAKDMPREYLSQLNSHVPKWEDGKLSWPKINPDDHAWDVACGNLLIAMIRGYFRLE